MGWGGDRGSWCRSLKLDHQTTLGTWSIQLDILGLPPSCCMIMFSSVAVSMRSPSQCSIRSVAGDFYFRRICASPPRLPEGPQPMPISGASFPWCKVDALHVLLFFFPKRGQWLGTTTAWKSLFVQSISSHSWVPACSVVRICLVSSLGTGWFSPRWTVVTDPGRSF